VTVLKKKRRYGKAFRELLGEGNLTDALHLGLEHIQEDPSVPVKEVIKLVHYMEFKKTMDCLLEKPTKWPQIRYDSSMLPDSLSEALADWNSFTSSFYKNNLRDVFANLKDGFHKDVISVAVGFRLHFMYAQADDWRKDDRLLASAQDM
jgi:hypothetical protein